MKLLARIKLEHFINTWWKFLLGFAILTYITKLDLEITTLENVLEGLAELYIIYAIWLIVVLIKYIVRVHRIRKITKHMTNQEKIQLCQDFSEAKAYKHMGQLVSVAGGYLVVRRRTMAIRWYIVRLDSIRKLFLSESLNTKNIQVYYQKDDGYWGDFMTGAFPKEKAVELYTRLKEMVPYTNTQLGYQIKSKLFDEEGLYGARQDMVGQLPHNMRAIANEMIAKNYKRNLLSEEELDTYIKKLASEGCFYAAVVNAIFWHFDERASDFYNAFGYPMVDANGEYNFDYLLIDYYSSMDNRAEFFGYRRRFHDFSLFKDGLGKLNPWKDDTGTGSSGDEQCYYAEKFLKKHGVKCTAIKLMMSPERLESFVASGWAIIMHTAGKSKMVDEYGKEIVFDSHAMFVTGLTSDGRFIVSSWGRKYYFTPDKGGEVRCVGLNFNGK